MLAALFGYTEQAPNFEQMTAQVARELDLPEALLDPQMAIDTLLQRYPELESAFVLDIADGEPDDATLRRALVVSKLLLNAFGPNTQAPTIGAAEYAQWLKDIEHFERAFGFQPGQLRGQGGAAGQGAGSGAGR